MFSGYVDDGERLAVEYLPHTATARSSSGADGYLICSLTASKEMLRKKQAGFHLLHARMLAGLHVGRGSQSGLRCLGSYCSSN